jgi:hypothetical protein
VAEYNIADALSAGAGAVAMNKTVNKKEVELTAEQRKAFTREYKVGILRQLHKNGLLTDRQLQTLIELQK